MPLMQVFGALRDGYQAEAERFYAALWAELREAGGTSRRQLDIALARVNETLPIWLQGMGDRLRRDLIRATEGVVAERAASPERAEALLAPYREEGGWPDAPILEAQALTVAPSRALVAAASGIVVAVAAAALAYGFLPAEQRMWGYGAAGVVGVAVGYRWFEQVRTQEMKDGLRQLQQDLERARRRVAAAIEQYVVDWVKHTQGLMAEAARSRSG